MSAETVRRRYREFDVALGRLLDGARMEGHTIPCQRGCSACCYELPIAFDFEMSALVARIRAMPEAVRERLLARVRGWVLSMHSAGIELYGGEVDAETNRLYHEFSIACPLLDRERQECTVYEDRPLACRAHHVINVTAEACKRGLASGTIPCVNVDVLCAEFGRSVLVDRDKKEPLPADASVVIKIGKLGTMLMTSLRKEGLMGNL